MARRPHAPEHAVCICGSAVYVPGPSTESHAIRKKTTSQEEMKCRQGIATKARRPDEQRSITADNGRLARHGGVDGHVRWCGRAVHLLPSARLRLPGMRVVNQWQRPTSPHRVQSGRSCPVSVATKPVCLAMSVLGSHVIRGKEVKAESRQCGLATQPFEQWHGVG